MARMIEAPTSRMSSGCERLDRRVRADRHELRRLDDAVGQRQPPEPGPGRAVGRRRDVVTSKRGAPADVTGAPVTVSGSPAGSPAAGSRPTARACPGSVRRGGGIS